MKVLYFLLRKEFKLFFRNKFLPRIIIMMTIMVLFVMPWAANMETHNMSLCIIDNDHSQTSARLINRINASDYFQLKATAQNYEEGLKLIEKGSVDILLEIPSDYEKKVALNNPPSLLIAANAVNSVKGGLGSTYLASVIENNKTDYVKILPLYNTYQDYKLFMIPSLMVILLALMCGFIPALNIVSEKELGTMEQINVTPIKKKFFILSKLIPFWCIGLIVLSLCILIAWLVYGFYPEGSLLTIYGGAALFILTMSGFGLVISNKSETLQQALFVMWFFLVIMILMSGLFTPISSMPDWAKTLTFANPFRYLVEIMRNVYMKASDINDLYLHFLVLASFAFIMNVWATISYKKRN